MEHSEMKKTYINPETILTEMELQQMIAESAQFGEGYKDPATGDAKDFNFLAFDDGDTDDEGDTSLPGFNVWED
jgi:hypothetical protein